MAVGGTPGTPQRSFPQRPPGTKRVVRASLPRAATRVSRAWTIAPPDRRDTIRPEKLVSNLVDFATLPVIDLWGETVRGRRVDGERITLALVELAPNAIVPGHQHEN